MPWNKDADQPGLTPGEARLIWTTADALQQRSIARGLRGKDIPWPLLWRVLWFSSRRISEALAVTPADLDGGRMRFVPAKTRNPQPSSCAIPAELVSALRTNALVRGLAPSARVFDVSQSGARASLKRAARHAGIAREVHPHMFRHGHARQLVRSMQRKGYPASVIEGAIKRALGHQSWAHVRDYVEPSAGEVADFQREAFEE